MIRHPASPRRVAKRVFSTLERFLYVEAVSGIVLLIAAAAALLWANSPAAESYHHVWEIPLTLALGDYAVSRSLHFLINDALMTVFFLVVGMEIRREIHEGALSNLRMAALPLAAALGGVIVPALIYLWFNSLPATRAGWAIPTATDIAFAVGVLALLGKSIPGSVRIFLLALAIIDDIAAVIIIAVFYSGGLDYSGFVIAAIGVLLVLGMQQVGIGSAFAYVIPGAILWFGLLKTGAHPTLAGLVLGLMTPVVSMTTHAPPAVRVQKTLHPWVAYGVMPLFALANAGVNLDGIDLTAAASQRIALGVAMALMLGKPLGIIAGSWMAVRLGGCRLPADLDWNGVVLVGCLGGIGFTMSIFIATLAFDQPALLGAAKAGVLVASLTAGIVGLVWGRFYLRQADK